ncbi:MAG: hypothetical protein LAO07_08100 [Acidobacteriia bacterium]|nr:hypothetical protein [Terriglobia bacterium]
MLLAKGGDLRARLNVPLFAPFVLLAAITAAGAEPGAKFVLLSQHPLPVITVKFPGAEGNKYGFEGGRVVKVGKTYHLFTSEMVGDPFWVKMKFGHWTSKNRLHWKRLATLYESSGEFRGKDPRAALWSPLPVYDDKEGRWSLFYVAYRSAPNTKAKWLNNYEGRIWRAISKTKGMDGIGGPYEDVGVILEPGPESQPWEGLQGTDSFFPYRVGETWYAFYGSANTEMKDERSLRGPWSVGLASAPELAGPWKRLPTGNPLTIEPVFIENPIVIQLNDGTYAAVYDCHTPNAIGYTFSRDGIHWEAGQALIVQPNGTNHWSSDVRTPLGLVPEGDGTFTLFYTGYQNVHTSFPDTSRPGDAAVGLVTLKLAVSR